VIAAAVLLVYAGCTEQSHTMESGEIAARTFIVQAPTYASGGYGLMLESSGTLRCENCFIYVFNFSSSGAGYGDRQGMVDEADTQGITLHRVVVLVSKGDVVQAVIDNGWDELQQRSIEDYESVGEDTSSPIPLYYCSEPRPGACPDEQEPVCSSDRYEYPNGCAACMKSTTQWYAKGSCQSGYYEQLTKDLNKGAVTKDTASFLILLGWNKGG
ncbi:hypothetical protein COY95_02600, partial [Candidatus Woesearchaeota archaeon CG_4_10_14_0_8_um_filter_47_5]